MDFTEIVKEFVKPELLILVPVLYLIGVGIKKTAIKDKFIPFILGIISIVLCGLYIFATSDIHTIKEIAMALFTACTQGVLIAGGSVYINQLYKQTKKTK
ncbi:MAG: phage holin family protein [Clostridiales bacterium]|nr:phage holin family protein [Clostridiales bacterium]